MQLEKKFLGSENLGSENKYLLQRINHALPKLPLTVVRVYAGLLDPDWRRNFYSEELDFLPERDFLGTRSRLLSKRNVEHMSSLWKAAEKAVLDHLPEDIHKLRALTERVEEDAKRAV